MKKLILALALFGTTAYSQVTVSAPPVGSCTVGLPDQIVASTSAKWTCYNGTWVPSFPVPTFPAVPVTFSMSTGSLPSVASGNFYGPIKFTKSGTLQNVTGAASSFTCTVNPVLVLYDCGTSASCSTATVLSSVTITASNSVISGTISSSTITSGNFALWTLGSGTCTALNISATAVYQ